MRALIVGGCGQLGVELRRATWTNLAPPCALDRAELDITSADDVQAAIQSEAWAVVINSAAYTAVDRAESEPEAAFAVNRDGPAQLASACAAAGIPLVHVSTDYVFDGAKPEPYIETDPVNPLNVYGQSKAEGEAAVREIHHRHLIVRTSWLYSDHGSNFVKTMLRLAGERSELKVVADQWGCPTSAADLAGAIAQLGDAIAQHGEVEWGTYHYCGAGQATWLDFASQIMDELASRGHTVPKLTAVTTDEFNAAAPRPRNSRLDCTRIEERFSITRRPWRDSLGDVLRSLCGDRAET